MVTNMKMIGLIIQKECYFAAGELVVNGITYEIKGIQEIQDGEQKLSSLRRMFIVIGIVVFCSTSFIVLEAIRSMMLASLTVNSIILVLLSLLVVTICFLVLRFLMTLRGYGGYWNIETRYHGYKLLALERTDDVEILSNLRRLENERTRI